MHYQLPEAPTQQREFAVTDIQNDEVYDVVVCVFFFKFRFFPLKGGNSRTPFCKAMTPYGE